MKKLLTLFSIIMAVTGIKAQDWITIDCNGFHHTSPSGGFYPVVINYATNFAENCGLFYASPDGNYSVNWTYPDPCSGDGFPGEFCFDYTNNQNIATAKLSKDMSNMVTMGFNTIRLVGFTPTLNPSGTSVTFPYNMSSTQYYSCIDAIVNAATTANLKVILLVGPRGTLRNSDGYTLSNDQQYLDFLTTISQRYATNATIMAYDLFNEPFTNLSSPTNGKYTSTAAMAVWNYTIKKNAPHQLTTLGFTDPTTVMQWDPQTVPFDFISFHPYGDNLSLTSSQNTIYSFLYWANKTLKRPWIIGETGYSATNYPQTCSGCTIALGSSGATYNLGIPSSQWPQIGTLADQQTYAQNTLQRGIDCSCQGYSWWQYQEEEWQNSGDLFGLVTYYNTTTQGASPYYGQTFKPAVSSFQNFPSDIQNTSHCTAPTNYYNPNNFGQYSVYGHVLDNNGNPIVNAVIYAQQYKGGSNTWPTYVTYTDANGNYALYSNTQVSSQGDFYNVIECSYPGYSVSQLVYPSVPNSPSTQSYSFTLTPTNYNGWAKLGSNDGNNKFGNTSGTTWTLGANQKIYKGNFLGDGNDEFLFVQNTGGNTDLMMLFSYDINTNTWVQIWNNNSSSSTGIYPYRGNLIVGDFGALGYDQLLGVSNGWMTMFSFNKTYINTTNPSAWNWLWSDGGSSSDAMKPYEANLIPGKFGGNAYTEILGVTGWMTMFRFDNNAFSTQSPNAWIWEWSDQGNSSNPMRVYPNLLPGNYDGSGATQLLGYSTPVTSGWITLFKFNTAGYGNQSPTAWSWVWSDYGSTSNCDMRAYNIFTPGDYEGKGYDQIMAFNSAVNNWGTKFDWGWNGSTWNFNWAWSTGSPTYLSDWNAGGGAANYYSVKIEKDMPRVLMAYRGSTFSTYLENNYSLFNICGIGNPLRPERITSKQVNVDSTTAKVYPNPAKSEINVELTNTESQSIDYFYLYNAMGQQVQSKELNGNTATTVSVNTLAPGIYFYRITTSENTIIKADKLIIIQ
jgi:hypothetical protein